MQCEQRLVAICSVPSCSLTRLTHCILCQQARDGWWEGEYLEYIRQVLRRKFFSLLEHNEQLPESAMNDLTTHMDEYARINSLGPYRQTGEAAIGTGLADGTPVEGAARAKIKPSSLRHLQKPSPKPKAIPGRDRVSAWCLLAGPAR